jgi:excisionase family DNA binding protein
LVDLAHLGVMDTTHPTHPTRDALEPVFTITELATELSVSTQALYDLRSKGRGPTGFRVGRQLRFRQSEIDAWLARLEAEDHTRHHPGGAR